MSAAFDAVATSNAKEPAATATVVRVICIPPRSGLAAVDARGLSEAHKNERLKATMELTDYTKVNESL